MTKPKNQSYPDHHEGSTLALALDKIAGFGELYQKMERNMSIAGKSKSTLKNYGRHLAKLALHFDCLHGSSETVAQKRTARDRKNTVMMQHHVI